MDGTGRLSVRTARDGDRVLVEIGDNGLGLDMCWRIVL